MFNGPILMQLFNFVKTKNAIIHRTCFFIVEKSWPAKSAISQAV